MRAAILFRSGVGAEVARLYAVKLWRERVAPGAQIEYLHNTAGTQTFAAVGFPLGYFQSLVKERPSKKLDLHGLEEDCVGTKVESVDLEADPVFKAVFAKYLDVNPTSGKLTPKM